MSYEMEERMVVIRGFISRGRVMKIIHICSRKIMVKELIRENRFIFKQ